MASHAPGHPAITQGAKSQPCFLATTAKVLLGTASPTCLISLFTKLPPSPARGSGRSLCLPSVSLFCPSCPAISFGKVTHCGHRVGFQLPHTLPVLIPSSWIHPPLSGGTTPSIPHTRDLPKEKSFPCRGPDCINSLRLHILTQLPLLKRSPLSI